jgi:hypothetical protein
VKGIVIVIEVISTASSLGMMNKKNKKQLALQISIFARTAHCLQFPST